MCRLSPAGPPEDRDAGPGHEVVRVGQGTMSHRPGRAAPGSGVERDLELVAAERSASGRRLPARCGMVPRPGV